MKNEAACMHAIKNTSLEKLGGKAQDDSKKGIKVTQNVGIHKCSNTKLITNPTEPLSHEISRQQINTHYNWQDFLSCQYGWNSNHSYFTNHLKLK